MRQGSPRVYARGAAAVALALLALLADPAWSPRGTVRAAQQQAAQASQQKPAPSLLVLNKADNTLAVVDPSTMQVVARIPTGDGPHEVVVSADGRTAYVSNYGAEKPGNSLSVIDLVARKETRRVDLGPLWRPHGLAERNGKVYFTSELARVVARYDPAADKVDFVIGAVVTGKAPDGLAWVGE